MGDKSFIFPVTTKFMSYQFGFSQFVRFDNIYYYHMHKRQAEAPHQSSDFDWVEVHFYLQLFQYEFDIIIYLPLFALKRLS